MPTVKQPNLTTNTFKQWWTRFSRTNSSQPSPQEEQDQILARASRFERLQAEPGFTELMEFLAERVNDAIIDAATTQVAEWDLKTYHVIRWDAKREMLDSARNYVEETLRLRDEIRKDRGEING